MTENLPQKDNEDFFRRSEEASIATVQFAIEYMQQQPIGTRFIFQPSNFTGMMTVGGGAAKNLYTIVMQHFESELGDESSPAVMQVLIGLLFRDVQTEQHQGLKSSTVTQGSDTIRVIEVCSR